MSKIRVPCRAPGLWSLVGLRRSARRSGAQRRER